LIGINTNFKNYKIKNFYHMDCIFCKIIKGEIPAAKIYEDNNFLAFLDISPVNKGHTLVVPKEHYENLMETPDELVRDLWVVVKKVALAVKKTVKADGLNFCANNGQAAGQIIFHTHIHVIPRFTSDHFKNWPNQKYNNGEIEKVAEEIGKKLKN